MEIISSTIFKKISNHKVKEGGNVVFTHEQAGVMEQLAKQEDFLNIFTKKGRSVFPDVN